MATKQYRTKLVAPGTYDNNGEPNVVTPERVRRWHKKGQELLEAGYKMPTPWGHKLQAVPTESDPYAADEESARWNAGYIVGYELDKDDSLWITATTPPGYDVDAEAKSLVNPADHTTISEFSPGIGNWTDGNGNEHPDVILHAALCTYPVQGGQTGVYAATAEIPMTGRAFMSAAGKLKFTALLSKGAPMAAKKKPEKAEAKEDKPEVKVDIDTDDTPDPEGDADLPPMPDGSEAPIPGSDAEESDVTPVADEDDNTQKIMDVMAKLGQPMLEGTDRNNVMERVLIALTHAMHAGASLQAGKDDPAEQGMAPDLGVHGSPDPNSMGMGGYGGGVTFMSSQTGKILKLDPMTAKITAESGNAMKERIKAEWAKIADCGPAAMKAIAHREIQMLDRVHMSVNPDTGKVTLPAAQKRLYDHKQLLLASGYFEFTSKLATAAPELNPILPKESEEDRQKKQLPKLRAQMMGQPVPE